VYTKLDLNKIFRIVDSLKIEIRIPDPLYRRLKISSANQGKTAERWIGEAIAEKLGYPTNPAWMRGFGQLRHLHGETRRIERAIADEFSPIDLGEWI
jgi:hypothetical protein